MTSMIEKCKNKKLSFDEFDSFIEYLKKEEPDIGYTFEIYTCLRDNGFIDSYLDIEKTGIFPENHEINKLVNPKSEFIMKVSNELKTMDSTDLSIKADYIKKKINNIIYIRSIIMEYIKEGDNIKYYDFSKLLNKLLYAIGIIKTNIIKMRV